MFIEEQLSTESQKQQKLNIARSIDDLTNHSGWIHLKNAIEEEINYLTPKNHSITSSDQAITVASTLTFINGLKKAITLVESQKKTIKQIEQWKTSD